MNTKTVFQIVNLIFASLVIYQGILSTFCTLLSRFPMISWCYFFSIIMKNKLLSSGFLESLMFLQRNSIAKLGDKWERTKIPTRRKIVFVLQSNMVVVLFSQINSHQIAVCIFPAYHGSHFRRSLFIWSLRLNFQNKNFPARWQTSIQAKTCSSLISLNLISKTVYCTKTDGCVLKMTSFKNCFCTIFTVLLHALLKVCEALSIVP